MKPITIKRGETPTHKNYVIYLYKRTVFKIFIYAEGKISPTKWLGVIFQNGLPVYIGIRPSELLDIALEAKRNTNLSTAKGNILKNLQEEFGNISKWNLDDFDVSSAILFRYLRSVKERFDIIV